MQSVARVIALCSLLLSCAVSVAYSLSYDSSQDYIAVRQTLNRYPLAIDGKDFAALSEVFAPNVVANYSTSIGVLSGLTQVEEVLQKSLAPVNTQHSLTTQVIDIQMSEYGEAISAQTTTYYTAAHFGQGAYYGQALYAYGKYLDVLTKTRQNESVEAVWRVATRELVYMGPYIGNTSVFLGP